MAEPKLHKQHNALGNALAYILLVILSFIWLFPFNLDSSSVTFSKRPSLINLSAVLSM